MPRTQKIILAALVFAIGVGALLVSAVVLHDEPVIPSGVSDLTSSDEEVMAFKEALEGVVSAKQGKKIDGLTPEDIMEAIPAIIPSDFNGVVAVLGQYDSKDGTLIFSNEESLDGAAGDIVAKGYETLRTNIYTRLKYDMRLDAAQAIERLQRGTTTQSPSEIPPATEAGTICTKDVKVCSDGSTVGRIGLNCEFAACPNERENMGQSFVCQPEQRLVDMCTEQYAPVCAAYQVQCVRAPCNPVPKTYGNSCFACMDKNVISYTAGACVEGEGFTM